MNDKMANPNEKEKESEFDDVPKETLVSLLKDKSKEIRLLTTKLGKLEEKYVKIFKEHKNLTKDREALAKFIKNHVFPNTSYVTECDAEIGSFALDKLKDIWNKQEEERNMAVANVMKHANKEMSEMEGRLKELASKQMDNLNQQSLVQIDNYKVMINDLNETNEKLGNEIRTLNEIIQRKNEEITRLQGLEQDYLVYEAEKLANQLAGFKNPDDIFSLENEIKKSQTTDEILTLKNDLEAAYEKITLLEVTLAQLRGEKQNGEQQASLWNLHHVHQQPKAEVRDYGTQTDEKSMVVPKVREPTNNKASSGGGGMNGHHGHTSPTNGNIGSMMQMPEMLTPSILDSGEERSGFFSARSENKLRRPPSDYMPSMSTTAQNGAGQLEYLKNIMTKYFLLLASNNQKEAVVLEQVIFTVLKFSSEDQKRIQDARKGGFWKSTKNIISDSLFVCQR